MSHENQTIEYKETWRDEMQVFDDCSITIRHSACKTKKSPTTIQKYVQYLVDNGYICHTGPQKVDIGK